MEGNIIFSVYAFTVVPFTWLSVVSVAFICDHDDSLVKMLMFWDSDHMFTLVLAAQDALSMYVLCSWV